MPKCESSGVNHAQGQSTRPAETGASLPLTVDHIRKLSKQFKVNLQLFIGGEETR